MLVKLRWALELSDLMTAAGATWPTLDDAYDPELHDDLDLLDGIILSLWGDAVRLTGASPVEAGAPRAMAVAT